MSLDAEILKKWLNAKSRGSRSNPEKEAQEELPTEFKPLEVKYGYKMAKAAKDFIERYLEAMFE